jgi:hypothetical protein
MQVGPVQGAGLARHGLQPMLGQVHTPQQQQQQQEGTTLGCTLQWQQHLATLPLPLPGLSIIACCVSAPSVSCCMLLPVSDVIGIPPSVPLLVAGCPPRPPQVHQGGAA